MYCFFKNRGGLMYSDFFPSGWRLRRRPDASPWSAPSAPTRCAPLVGAFGADQTRPVDCRLEYPPDAFLHSVPTTAAGVDFYPLLRALPPAASCRHCIMKRIWWALKARSTGCVWLALKTPTSGTHLVGAAGGD